MSPSVNHGRSHFSSIMRLGIHNDFPEAPNHTEVRGCEVLFVCLFAAIIKDSSSQYGFRMHMAHLKTEEKRELYYPEYWKLLQRVKV